MMLLWLSCAASFASSTNISMKSWLSERCGRIFLIATIFWNPSTPRMRAFQTSAIPPVAIFSTSTYWPKRTPSVGSSSSTRGGSGTGCGNTGCETGTRSSTYAGIFAVLKRFGVGVGVGVGVGAGGAGAAGRGTLPVTVFARAFFSRPDSVSDNILSRSLVDVRFGSGAFACGAAAAGAGVGVGVGVGVGAGVGVGGGGGEG